MIYLEVCVIAGHCPASFSIGRWDYLSSVGLFVVINSVYSF